MPIKKIPLKETCFRCEKEVTIKFCPPLKNYVQKNNWGYWTEREEYNKQYACSDCLKFFYYEDHLNFRKQVSNRKKVIFKTYLSLDVL